MAHGAWQQQAAKGFPAATALTRLHPRPKRCTFRLPTSLTHTHTHTHSPTPTHTHTHQTNKNNNKNNPNPNPNMTLQIIIIGAGLIGPRHAESVLSNPSTNLLALIDPSPSAAPIATSLNTLYFPSLSALLTTPNTPHPDAAIVCTPNHTHVSIAQDLLSHNIHILLEKPISDNIPSALSLLKTATQPQHSHLKLLIGHHRRFNAYMLKTKEIITSGSLGPLIAINGLWTLQKPPSYFAPDWRRAASSGGVLSINLIHDIDLLHDLFGPITRVFAEKTPPQRPATDASHTAEEGAAITLRFASGLVGTFLVCDATPSPHNFEAGTGENPLIWEAGKKRDADFYRIFGARASLSVPDMRRWSYDGCDGEEGVGGMEKEKGWGMPLRTEEFEVQKGTPFDLQLQHFVEVIAGREEPRCTGVEGLRALVVVQAVKTALEEGRAVEVRDVEAVLAESE
ncbi:NAD(P)-binding protein [Aspergillus heteromorphus CBS 117.55]|uniref:NAD(P)-binding protein n=1 Tax=Aspergillus heteromorphus CBS 117.55 TaxID=1448321 RepID=A0A317WHS2_9EURO|nr:NAD(P)-binding protein [Aspergillus heteromorphus CBS 117.55]PWY84812.1 NAD(P)-binding protein [Aspergillus heteromorphus CBS 117.55]